MAADAAAGFRDIFFTAEDGLRLHARDYAPAGRAGGRERLPLVCLPGLSRNARDFHQLALLVSHHPAAPRRVVALDYRGRGESARDPQPENYTVAVECRDVLTACALLGLRRCVFAGTSRGGLILHVMAAVRPDLIAGAILNDIGPEIESDGLRQIRDYLGRQSFPSSFEAAADILRGIHGDTFSALLHADWLDMAHAIYAERDGRIVADHDPTLVASLQALDLDKPLPALWPQFALLAARPLLVVRGEHSRILSAGTVERMTRGHVTVRTVTAFGQGHAPLLHSRDVYPAITHFLDLF